MPRILSLNFRKALYSRNTGEVPVVLTEIDHPKMEDGPLRMSTDNKVSLSLSPLLQGTRHLGMFYYYVTMTATVPSEEEGTPTATSISFENVDQDMVNMVRSILTPATVSLKLVLASRPDYIEEEYTGFQLVQATYDSNQITIDLTRENFILQGYPYHLMGKSRCPGIFAT